MIAGVQVSLRTLDLRADVPNPAQKVVVLTAVRCGSNRFDAKMAA